jgi:hypothetical protein
MTLLPPGVRSTWPSLHRHAQGASTALPCWSKACCGRIPFLGTSFCSAVGRPLAPLWSNLGISACERHVRSTFDTAAKVENQTTPKISRKSIFRRLCDCEAP